MLQPKRMKYRKQFRGKMGGLAVAGGKLNFGEYGLKVTACSWLTSNQIEAARKAIVHFTKRSGKMWLRVFPDKSFTGKGLGVGMGSGKGDVVGYVAVVKPGKVIFELSGVSESIAREALKRAGDKLPIGSRIISKND